VIRPAPPSVAPRPNPAEPSSPQAASAAPRREAVAPRRAAVPLRRRHGATTVPRRVRTRPGSPGATAARIAGVAALAIAAVAVGSAPATAASARAQQVYACENAPDDGTTPSRPDTFQLGMTLDVPASVAPGGTISLRGTADVRLPESYRQAIEYFSVAQLDAVSDTLSATVTVGGATVAQPADRWSTGPQKAGNPLVLTAPVSFPTFRIPADATGAVTIAMPGNGFAATSFPGKTPAKVAFNARATARGPVSFPFKASCFLKSGGPNVIATIPVSAPATAGGTATTPSGGSSRTDDDRGERESSGGSGTRTTTSRSGASRSGPGSTGGTSTTGGTSSGGSAATPSRSGANANPFGSSSGGGTDRGATASASGAGGGGDAAGADAAEGGTVQDPVASAIPELAASRDEDGVRIGSTWLWIAGLVLCGGLAAWAVVSQLRLRALMDDEDR